MRNIFISYVFPFLFLSMCNCCNHEDIEDDGVKTNDTTVRLTVASQRADCIGVGERKCFLVKEGDEKEWSFLYAPIAGFDYEEGIEYVLEVKITPVSKPVEDSSSLNYTLLRVISKTPKGTKNKD